MNNEKLAEKAMELLSKMQATGQEHLPVVIENFINYKMYLHSSLIVTYAIALISLSGVALALLAKKEIGWHDALIGIITCCVIFVPCLVYSVTSLLQINIAPISYVIEQVARCK